MRAVTYSMGMSLDGYIVGPDGGFDWSVPDADLFEVYTEELRQTSVHLLGRRLYEAMLYWEAPDDEPSFDTAEREWARLWRALPKVVFSTTLSAVAGTNTRLATASPAAEIARLRAESDDGEIAIGGATLAAAAADLIDEYRVSVYPVLVGGGTPLFPETRRQVDLELIDTRTFASKIVYSRYRVSR